MLKLDNLNIYILPVTPFQQNCSIVQCTKTFETAIIDPGGEIDSITHFIQSNKNMQVKYILITHGHLDHCGQARNLANRINVPIYGPHKEDIFWLDQLEQRQKQYASGNYVFEETKNFTPDNWLDEGQQLSLGEHIIDIIHTPGHTPGHIVFHINKLKIAWVGDMIFKHAVGRSDFPRGNTQDLMHSIVKKLLVLGDDYTFICGHGDISTFGHERKYNPYIQGYLD
ncbi:MAG: hypothetical protein RLZZ210_409 [Pseudomonadota bacterium]|jgi:glyoxylase-like metal-dependent hydrolase (beta-lactamase superfamily II)